MMIGRMNEAKRGKRGKRFSYANRVTKQIPKWGAG
jgi:hypothetical protein